MKAKQKTNLSHDCPECGRCKYCGRGDAPLEVIGIQHPVPGTFIPQPAPPLIPYIGDPIPGTYTVTCSTNPRETLNKIQKA